MPSLPTTAKAATALPLRAEATGGTAHVVVSEGDTLKRVPLIQVRDGGVQRPEWYATPSEMSNPQTATEVLNATVQRAQGGERVVVTGSITLDPTHQSPFGSFETFGGIGAKSGTILDLRGAELTMPPTASGRYSFVRIYDVEDVEVWGGEFVGDRAAHLGTAGEFGFGVLATKCNNIILDRQYAREMWGDGFQVGGLGEYADHVTMIKPRVAYARRQGISVVGARDLTMHNVRVDHIAGANPQSAIDFEPDTQAQPNLRCRVYGLRCTDVEKGVIFQDNGNQDVWVYDAQIEARAAGVLVGGGSVDCGISGAHVTVPPTGTAAFWALLAPVQGYALGDFEVRDSVLIGGEVPVLNSYGDFHGLRVHGNRVVATRVEGRAAWMGSGVFRGNRVEVEPGAGNTTEWTVLFGGAAVRGDNLYVNRGVSQSHVARAGLVVGRERYVDMRRDGPAGPVEDETGESIVVGENAPGSAFGSRTGRMILDTPLGSVYVPTFATSDALGPAQVMTGGAVTPGAPAASDAKIELLDAAGAVRGHLPFKLI